MVFVDNQVLQQVMEHFLAGFEEILQVGDQMD
jgi:hypothetical protein